MRRSRAEATLALLFAAVMVLAGGGAIYFVFTMSVHTDPASVPSSSAAPAARDLRAVEEARRLARSWVVDHNLPALSVAVANAFAKPAREPVQ